MSDLSRLNDLFHQYSSSDVVSATKSTEAFASEVFDIQTSDGSRYFLKILRDQDPTAIANEVEMQKLLMEKGIQTPEYLEIKSGEYIGHHNSERFVISRYINGSSPRVVSPKLIEEFGVILAKLHACLNNVTIPDSTMQWLNPKRVSADIDGYEGEVKEQIQELLSYGQPIFDAGLPQAVIHGDLWLSNVFAEDDHITTVFDLETAERTVRLVDIARTYTSLRFNSEFDAKKIISGLINGYNSVSENKLSDAEIDNIGKAIVYVCGACATWHAVHGTRYRDPYVAFGLEVMALELDLDKP